MGKVKSRNVEIGKRVLSLIDKTAGLNKTSLAKHIGYDPSYLRRLTLGKHNWTIDIAQAVINGLKDFGLDAEIDDILIGRTKIPVIAEVSAGSAFQWTDGGHPVGNGFDFIYTKDVPGVSEDMAEECYAVRVHGDSMLPVLKNGDILIVKPSSREEIVNGDNVVFKDKDFNAYVKMAEFRGGELILNSFNSAFKPLIFNKNDIVLMDKVIVIIKS